MPSDTVFDAAALTTWARRLLEARGVDPDKADAVAAVLVEADLLGHDTHGLALLGPYLGKLDKGGLVGRGEIAVLSDRPAALLWDGNRLPGPWVTLQAIATASERARAAGAASVVTRRSGHIACLAAYLEAPARDGLMVEIYSSDPSVASVAPFAGKRAVFTPNPLAIGIPTSGDPVMIDISTSITTNGMSARLQAAGKRFPGKWLLDNEGAPTDDPAVFSDDPKLLGGVDAGHKGYGLTLMVEAMTDRRACRLRPRRWRGPLGRDGHGADHRHDGLRRSRRLRPPARLGRDRLPRDPGHRRRPASAAARPAGPRAQGPSAGRGAAAEPGGARLRRDAGG